MKRILFGFVIVLMAWPGTLLAGDASSLSLEKADRVLSNAVKVLEEALNVPEGKEEIPPSLVRSAAGVGIFPGIIKGGFLVGGQAGDGFLLRHDAETGQWYGPAFYSFGSASFGLQAGVEGIDVLLFVRTERGLDGLLKNQATLGGDVSVAAGPVGRGASTGVSDRSMDAEVLSYTHSVGLFAGMSVSGAKITPRDAWNYAFHKRKLTAKQILMEVPAAHHTKVRRLIELLQKYAMRKDRRKK
ncbi:MAG: hypothetical protein D6703_05070 [Zetaproteobacteria bacterium]|nr:MAG: hypothetical protein D6703_05070 [Zetaproteobacteria bacterium]